MEPIEAICWNRMFIEIFWNIFCVPRFILWCDPHTRSFELIIYSIRSIWICSDYLKIILYWSYFYFERSCRILMNEQIINLYFFFWLPREDMRISHNSYTIFIRNISFTPIYNEYRWACSSRNIVSVPISKPRRSYVMEIISRSSWF